MKKTTIYKVYNTSNTICYKCATTTRSQDEIICNLGEMFHGLKSIYKVYCDNNLIHVFNSKRADTKIKTKKAILEVDTGYIYNNVNELMDNLNLCKADALKLVNKSFNYKFINQ
jgi:hypothetical protein